MTTMTRNPSFNHQHNPKDQPQQKLVTNEIDGLIRVYNDGHVERPQIVPCVTCSLSPDLGLTCTDITIDNYTNIWARCYVPNDTKSKNRLPLLVYFHGGGFCVGSASWSCYHEFLAKLASKTNSVVVSVNYRLAPENPLPAAYDDGVKALAWVKQQEFVTNQCDFAKIYLAGDSAGANIAYNLNLALKIRSLEIKGLILMQPFIGGENRTQSEKYMVQPPRSALTLAASDAYWRMALPAAANRDHPWCNPTAAELRGVEIMVFVSEMDILRERNLEWCGRLASEGLKVEKVVCKGVGHAFQILNKSHLSQIRVNELFCHIKNFINR